MVGLGGGFNDLEGVRGLGQAVEIEGGLLWSPSPGGPTIDPSHLL